MIFLLQPTSVLVQSAPKSGHVGREESLILAEAQKRSISIREVSRKLADRRSLPLDRSMLVVGNLRFVQGALRQLNIPIPPDDFYPSSLVEYLHRSVWRSTLSQISIPPEGLFVKPADRTKRFTGFVISYASDLARYGITSPRTQLWCSERVHWVSQWRVYITNGKICNISFCDGDSSVFFDEAVVLRAIANLEASPFGRAGYALDFGVLSTGKTAFIECNDGFALGAYGLLSRDYFGLLWARWQQLVFKESEI